MSEQEVFDALKYHIEVDEDGSRRYYNTNGELHRTDGAAVEWASGTKEWYQNGLLHRTNGPAVIRAGGGKEWWQNGLRHRTDGAAVEWASGTKEWYQNGQLHRTDVAAIEWSDGDKWWFIDGVRLTEDEFNQRVKMSEVEVFNALKYRVVVNEYGARGYYNSADQLHKTDGPAVIWADGTKLWFQNGLIHRTDGPAIVGSNGDKFWFINGRMMTENEFNQAVKQKCLNKMSLIH